MKRNVEGWKKMLPDYEFIRWDLGRFEKDSSVWVSEAMEQKKYAFASDYIRLYAVYHFGGIYMDMDVEVRRPFDPLLDSHYMFAYETPDQKRIEAGCFGAESHDPFLKACLDHYQGRHFVGKTGSPDMRPLSKVMYDIMNENHFSPKIYSWDYFTAKTFATGKVTPTGHTFAIHHFAGSWKSKKERRVMVKARGIRKAHPVTGKAVAFVYEKVNIAILAVKEGGIRGLGCRVKHYIEGRR